MPSEVRCTRCGRILDAAEFFQAAHQSTVMFCRACAAWQNARASDQEDRQDSTGLGDIRVRSILDSPASDR